MAAPTTPQEVAEKAMEVVATLGAAEPPARGAAARGDTVMFRSKATEASGGTRTEAPTEVAAPTPRRTAVEAPTLLLCAARSKWSLLRWT